MNNSATYSILLVVSAIT